jgi:hypothetical protein
LATMKVAAPSRLLAGPVEKGAARKLIPDRAP